MRSWLPLLRGNGVIYCLYKHAFVCINNIVTLSKRPRMLDVYRYLGVSLGYYSKS